MQYDKKYNSIIKKTKNKYNEITLLPKTNLDSMKGSISRSLTDYILTAIVKEKIVWKKKSMNFKLHKLVKTFNILI